MYNQWGRQPMRKDSWTLVLGIIIIGMMGYLFIPNFFKSDPTVPATNLNDVNQPNTYDPNALNSAGNPIQNSPSTNNILNNGNSNNELTTGYWILFVSNGTVQQLSVNAQEYALVQGLIESDSKGIAKITVFLIDNGQIHQFVITNETYSIISNIAIINTRSSNTSAYSSPPTAMLPTTAISETLTVSNPSTTGFTVALNPGLNGLLASNFTLLNSMGNPVTITNVRTSDNGATYAVSAVLSAGQTYTITATSTGYTFGTAQNVAVTSADYTFGTSQAGGSSAAIKETLTVSNPSTSGFTVALNPALNGLTTSNFTLVNSSGNPVTLTSATTSGDGASYTITVALSAGQTYTLTAADAGYTFATAQTVVVPQ
ncbi:MAG: hypothetical protein P4L49_10915 [Desulfosporosinus sp.]|nr:hypothetical protein [Desulfosporosinus sp.]